jgi:excisionase family DNA binding protein
VAELLTPKEAAARLGVSVRTLDRIQADGRIAPVRHAAGKGVRRRFDAADIDQLLKDKK